MPAGNSPGSFSNMFRPFALQARHCTSNMHDHHNHDNPNMESTHCHVTAALCQLAIAMRHDDASVSRPITTSRESAPVTVCKGSPSPSCPPEICAILPRDYCALTQPCFFNRRHNDALLICMYAVSC